MCQATDPKTISSPLTVMCVVPAHQLIGYDGDDTTLAALLERRLPRLADGTTGTHYVRIKGGRSLYESVDNRDGQLDDRGLVELHRWGGEYFISRLIDEDTLMEVVYR